MAIYAIDSPALADIRVKTDALVPYVLAMLFALLYTQGYLERGGVPRPLVKLMVEMPVFLMMIHLANRGIRQLPPGCALMALYVVWTLVAAIYHGDGAPAALLYGRYVIYAYVVFVTVWSTPLTTSAVRRINRVLVLLFLLQIAASAHEAFVRGERVEAHVGALFADGGALATEFPLFAMALAVPLYLYWRGNPLLLVLSWAFFLVGYASGKRAIYFLGPFLYVCILGWYVLRVRGLQALRRSAGGILVFACLCPLLLLGVSRSHGISHLSLKSTSERVTYALDAAAHYTTGQEQAGRTTGRTATSRRVFATLWGEEMETVLFGWGPRAGRIGEGQRYESLRVTYGICGWARDVICVGWPAMLVYLLFHLRLFFALRSCAAPKYNRYWMALRFGAEIGFCVMLLGYIGYSASWAASGQLSFVYFYLLALLMSPRHRHIISSRPAPSGIGRG